MNLLLEVGGAAVDVEQELVVVVEAIVRSWEGLVG